MSDTSVSAFERIKHVDEHGEFWSARELVRLLGYVSWQNFETVIDEAKAVCQTSGGDVERLFNAVIKKSRGRNARDYRLTRHACYLVAESADGRKPGWDCGRSWTTTAERQTTARNEHQG